MTAMTGHPMSVRLMVLAAASLLSAATPAEAGRALNTGGADGAYNRSFCPRIVTELGKAKLEYTCTPSAGTYENLVRVNADPLQLGYGQLDVIALESERLGGLSQFTRIRTDDVRECVFAVTRNKKLTNFGELAVSAGSLRFILPPEKSGSAGTFDFLRSIDPKGLGAAKAITHEADVDAAIRKALSAEDTVSFFVQFPDPDNPRFKLIKDLGGHLVPVLDRTLLRQIVDGQKVYFAQETQIEAASWLKSGQKVITACTPMVLFSGTPDKVTDPKLRQDLVDVIATLKALPSAAVMPQESFWAALWKRTRELSAISAEGLADISEDARKQAGPMFERAKEAAAPVLDKAKELGTKVYDKAKGELKELMDKATPPPEPKKP